MLYIGYDFPKSTLQYVDGVPLTHVHPCGFCPNSVVVLPSTDKKPGPSKPLHSGDCFVVCLKATFSENMGDILVTNSCRDISEL